MIIITELNKNYNNINQLFEMKYVSKYIRFIYHIIYEIIKYKNYYIQYTYYFYKLKNIIYYDYSEKYHREDGPAYTCYNKNGKKLRKYYLNDIRYNYKTYLKLLIKCKK